jgi:hypothetical protein
MEARPEDYVGVLISGGAKSPALLAEDPRVTKFVQCFCVDPNVSPCPLECVGPALALGIALSTSAIATSVPAEAPVTSARLSTTCRFMKSCPPHKVIYLSPLQER